MVGELDGWSVLQVLGGLGRLSGHLGDVLSVMLGSLGVSWVRVEALRSMPIVFKLPSRRGHPHLAIILAPKSDQNEMQN